MERTQEQTNNDGSPAPPQQPPHMRRPIIFLDIDGVLNTTKHNTQIHFEAHLLKRLKCIIETTDALIVLTTFWRHFHEYITYVLHRHGIDVGRHMLPLPMGSTRGKQTTKKFLHFHSVKQLENGSCFQGEEGKGCAALNNESIGMFGRTAEDEGEYSSRAEEIEAWLKIYGDQHLGSNAVDDNDGTNHIQEYAFHKEDWKYVILDDRPSAAKPGTPLFDRFVLTATKSGLSEEDAEKAIMLLRFGP